MLKWPVYDKVLVKSLSPALGFRTLPIDSVELLGSAGKSAWKPEERGLVVDLSACDPLKGAFVLKIL